MQPVKQSSPLVKPITILMADDDQEDREMARRALVVNQMANDLHFVKDGEELLEYLRHEGRYGPTAEGVPGLPSPRPGLILLDLNMPRMDGREALEEIKKDTELRRIPVIVLTTSSTEEDIYRSYDIGANSFITKPVTFQSLVEVTKSLGRYWFSIVELPE